MLVGNLCSPFATAAISLLQASIRALQVTILNNWCRIGNYGAEVLKGIVVCWCRISEENAGTNKSEDTRLLLVETLKLLRAGLSNEAEALGEIDTVLASDDRLRGLL